MKTLTKKIKSKKGVTLVELLVAMAILGLLTVAIVTSMTGSLSVYKTTVAHSESSVLISTLSKSINDELRYARDIKNDATVPSGFTYTSSAYGKESHIITVDGKVVVESGKAGSKITYPLLGSGAYTTLSADTTISLDYEIYGKTIQIFVVELKALNDGTVINSTSFTITPITE